MAGIYADSLELFRAAAARHVAFGKGGRMR